MTNSISASSTFPKNLKFIKFKITDTLYYNRLLVEDKEIIETLKNYLNELNLSYDDKAEFRVMYASNEKLFDGRVKNVYTVSFWKKIFEYETYFAKMDSVTLELYYIMTPTRLISPPAKK